MAQTLQILAGPLDLATALEREVTAEAGKQSGKIILTGGVRIGGMISMIDNINRILDRVALYLA